MDPQVARILSMILGQAQHATPDQMNSNVWEPLEPLQSYNQEMYMQHRAPLQRIDPRRGRPHDMMPPGSITEGP